MLRSLNLIIIANKENNLRIGQFNYHAAPVINK